MLIDILKLSKSYFLAIKDPRHMWFANFWAGRHHQNINHFEELDEHSIQKLSEADLLCVYGSTIIEHRSDLSERIFQLLPAPLAKAQFSEYIDTSLQSERQAGNRGLLTQPVELNKCVLAAAIGLANGKTNFVETGTYVGSSIRKVACLFQSLKSVEASADLHAVALHLLASQTNVELVCGDARDFLKGIPPDYLNDSVVFLDAHYSTGITSSAFGVCPVFDEIGIILEKAPDAVVIVDDLRTMNGRRGYPSLQGLFQQLPAGLPATIIFDQLIFSGRGTVTLPDSLKMYSEP